MSLHIYKYKKLPSQENLISNSDSIEDLVVVYDLGFDYNPNGKQFFQNVFFCFHYCIDKYQNKKSVSFEILSSHEQTNSYCYIKDSNNFFKENHKYKKVDVENTQIAIPSIKLDLKIEANENFDSIFQKIKNDLITEQKSIVQYFDSNNITYNVKDISEFHDLVIHHFFEYHKTINDKLYLFLKEYDAISLGNSLSEKDKINIKRMKV